MRYGGPTKANGSRFLPTWPGGLSGAFRRGEEEEIAGEKRYCELGS